MLHGRSSLRLLLLIVEQDKLKDEFKAPFLYPILQQSLMFEFFLLNLEYLHF